MMFRGDQHVDDWPEVAVDYLDGQLDQETRLAVERHLSTCPDCTARLHRQQYVVSFLQETPLDDPPEDLEYRAIGELIFPSPGGQPVGQPVGGRKSYRTPKWQRTIRAWLPATVAVVALLAAVIGYGIARTGSGAELATNTERQTDTAATAAAAGSTAAPEATLVGASPTSTTAGATTTSAGVASEPPSTTAVPVTVVATQDRRTMIREIEKAQAPAFVSFRAPLPAPTKDQNVTTTVSGSTPTTAGDGSTGTTAGGGTPTTTAAGPDATLVTTVSAAQAANIVGQIAGFTGLKPLDKSLWLGGPTFAAFLPRVDAEEFVDLVRSIGASLGLVVALTGGPPVKTADRSAELLKHKSEFPMLEAQRALQPGTWGWDFTTSTLALEDTGDTLPDQGGSHVVIIIWIQE